jgi:hypothetical protein
MIVMERAAGSRSPSAGRVVYVPWLAVPPQTAQGTFRASAPLWHVRPWEHHTPG